MVAAPEPSPSPKRDYRPDIDGLRTIAVLSVAIYHFETGGVPGGFVGVDVFFVISGYLITMIIVREMLTGTFSFAEFYRRRACRLLPAFLTVAGATLAAGYVCMFPNDYAELAEQIIYATFAAANYYFLWYSGGYFDRSADMLAMLHMWSLAVEEQFYFLWPLILLATLSLFRKSRRAVILVLAAIICGSFAVAAWTVKVDQPTAFYMLHARAWELGLGGLLAFAPNLNSRLVTELARAAGLALIGYAIFFTSAKQPFPGPAALAPCVGAALIVWPSNFGSVGSLLLSLRPMVALGLISYSLYLWHWPVAVIARHLSLTESFDQRTGILLLILSMALAAATYRFVERPFRRGFRFPTPQVLLGAAGSMATIAAVALAIVRYDGIPSRVDAEVVALASGARDFSPFRKRCHRDGRSERPIEDSCTIGANVSPTIAMWADSHGMELAGAIGAELAKQDRSLVSITYSACPPALDYYSDTRPGCAAHNGKVLAYLLKSENVRDVYMIAYYDHYMGRGRKKFLNGLIRSAQLLSDAGKKVTIFTPIPTASYSVPQRAAKASFLDHEKMPTIDFKSYRKDNKEIFNAIHRIEKIKNVRIIDISSILCDNGQCSVAANGKSLYFDNQHLSNQGARLIARSISKLLL